MSIERERLRDKAQNWRQWGPYLSERAWGTVREDYSRGGSAWDYFPHDHARSRVYRWNEDGLGGICDEQQRLCFALALWNGKDPILKERLFGLTGPEGNHGEDVKEEYFYLDSTPSHSYMKMLYRYPQATFPYADLIATNRKRGRDQDEYELRDTGVLADGRYFDVQIEYAKSTPDEILIRISATNCGPDAATLHLLPTLWFRNTWAWGRDDRTPQLSNKEVAGQRGVFSTILRATHGALGEYEMWYEAPDEVLFTNNETNVQKLFGAHNTTPYVKDAFHEYVVHGNRAAVNPEHTGSKAAGHYTFELEAGATRTIRLCLRKRPVADGRMPQSPFQDYEATFAQRLQEADDFYRELQEWGRRQASVDPGLKRLHVIQRQALAGMLWSKQFYHFDVDKWLEGDPSHPPPPADRKQGRNSDWGFLSNAEVLSMPDKWEYPWFASWDLAFHCLPLALVDAGFAKRQLELLTREWYQHPNGQIPAYEWAFDDVNPPVLAWAAWRVYQVDRKYNGTADRAFLERVFHKLLLNFTWWVNRKDSEGKNVFQGGFLGLDNIGVFDRSAPLPTGGHIEQSDGTSWMGMYSLNLMKIALALAEDNPVYEDIASKFFEHFLYIAAAMNNISGDGIPLWNEDDEFFYDVLHLPNAVNVPLTVRSMVGLIPLFAVETIEPETLNNMPGFRARLQWFLKHRPHLSALISRWNDHGVGERRLVALTRGHRLKRLLKRALDPNEFLSDFGVRALSKFHADNPFELQVDGQTWTVRYEPSESRSGLFGGNSNWRGPIWFPLNYLLIESLQKFHHYFGDDFKVECPTGSGQFLTLNAIADFLSHRLIRLFEKQDDPTGVLFHEYYDGDTGRGLGASHQTGWTGLIAKLIQQQSEHEGDA